jgi:hypothetical protein
VEPDTQAYIDRTMDAVRAQNDTRFVGIFSQLEKLDNHLDMLSGQIAEVKRQSPSHLAMIGFAISIILGVVAIWLAFMAFAGDRFDAGMTAASGLLKAADAAQKLAVENSKQISLLGEKMDQILNAVKSENVK